MSEQILLTDYRILPVGNQRLIYIIDISSSFHLNLRVELALFYQSKVFMY